MEVWSGGLLSSLMNPLIEKLLKLDTGDVRLLRLVYLFWHPQGKIWASSYIPDQSID